MLFTSLCTALLAAAQLATGGPVQSQDNALFRRQTPPTCVQGLILPYSKQDLEYLRTWMLETEPNTNDFIGKNGWFQWTLGSVKICNYNTNPNGTTDVYLNHKEIARCLEAVRDTCCSPESDQCRAGRAEEYSIEGKLLACRVSYNSTVC